MLNKILVWLGVKRDAKVEAEAFAALAGGIVRKSDLDSFADSVLVMAEDAATRLDEACRNAKPKRAPRKKSAAKKSTAKRVAKKTQLKKSSTRKKTSTKKKA